MREFKPWGKGGCVKVLSGDFRRGEYFVVPGALLPAWSKVAIPLNETVVASLQYLQPTTLTTFDNDPRFRSANGAFTGAVGGLVLGGLGGALAGGMFGDLLGAGANEPQASMFRIDFADGRCLIGVALNKDYQAIVRSVGSRFGAPTPMTSSRGQLEGSTTQPDVLDDSPSYGFPFAEFKEGVVPVYTFTLSFVINRRTVALGRKKMSVLQATKQSASAVSVDEFPISDVVRIDFEEGNPVGTLIVELTSETLRVPALTDHFNNVSLVYEEALRLLQASDAETPSPAQEETAIEASGDDVFLKIEKLSSLRDKGLLSAEEFENKKQSLLDRI